MNKKTIVGTVACDNKMFYVINTIDEPGDLVCSKCYFDDSNHSCKDGEHTNRPCYKLNLHNLYRLELTPIGSLLEELKK